MAPVNFSIIKPIRPRSIPGNPPHYPALVRPTKEVREEIYLHGISSDLESICGDTRKEGLPLEKYLFVDPHDMDNMIYMVFKIVLDTTNHVQVAVGSKPIPQEIEFLQLGVYLSELFGTEERSDEIYFHNGLCIFSVS